MKLLLDFIKKGVNLYQLFQKLFIIFFILYVVSPTNINESSKQLDISLVDSSKHTYSRDLINYEPVEFTESILTIDPFTSNEIRISNIISSYDDDIKENMSKILGQIIQLVSPKKSGQVLLKEIINSFNVGSHNFSRDVENTCVTLIIQSKELGIFSDFSNLDSLVETQEKIEKIENDVKKHTDDVNNDIMENLKGAIVNTVVTPMTGDVVSTLVYISNLGSNLYELIRKTKNNAKEKKALLEQQNSISEVAEKSGQIITESQKIEFESKLFTFSKLYCSFGYNLRIEFVNSLNINNEQSIVIIGDKVPYNLMINLITTLEENIAYKITKLSSEIFNESTKYTIMSLISLQQRLGILKKITDALYSIVNFSSKIQIMKMNKYATPITMYVFKEYLNSQLEELNKLLSDLQKKFPLKEKELDDRKKNIEADIELIVKDLNIKDMEQNATRYARQRVADRSARETSDWWLASKTVTKSLIDVGVNSTIFITEGIGNYTEIFIGLLGSGPIAIIKFILLLMDTVLYDLLSSLTGLLLVISGIFFVYFMFGGIIISTIRLFYDSIKLLIAIVIGGLLIFYKNISTLFNSKNVSETN